MKRETLVWTVGAIAAYMLWIRPWQQRWGATDEEVARPMPGDDIVSDPDGITTRAITIHARPEDIFPWLVQMGYQRGGLYSYDWLDRLFGFLDRPSAERILPEFQQLKVGDVIPVGRGNGFPVTALEPNRVLVLSGEENGTAWTWQMALYPQEGSTRFVTRNRMRFPQTLSTRLFMLCLDLAAWIMVRKWLLNIKRLSERLANARGMLASDRHRSTG